MTTEHTIRNETRIDYVERTRSDHFEQMFESNYASSAIFVYPGIKLIESALNSK